MAGAAAAAGDAPIPAMPAARIATASSRRAWPDNIELVDFKLPYITFSIMFYNAGSPHLAVTMSNDYQRAAVWSFRRRCWRVV